MKDKTGMGETSLSRIAGEGASRSEAGEGMWLSHTYVGNKPIGRARALRRNSTEVERRLWGVLRDRRLRGYKFRRQMPIGNFIVDFACIKFLLTIEADGSQHADAESDRRRTAWLEARGWQVLRFWDNEILMNPGGVAEVISATLEERKALTLPRLRRGPLPLPQCGRGER